MLGDLYQVRFRQSLFNRNLDNVMYFQHVTVGSPAGDAEALALTWRGVWLPILEAVQHVLVLYRYIDVMNLNTPQDFFQLDVTGYTINNGNVTNECYPEFNSVLYMKNTPLRDVKGRFNLRGLSEGHIENRNIAGNVASLYEDLRIQLGDDIADVAGNEWHPHVVRRVRVPPEGQGEFIRYEYVEQEITGVTLFGVTSKKKAKRGRRNLTP